MAKNKPIDSKFLKTVTVDIVAKYQRTVERMAKIVKTEAKNNASIEDQHTPEWLKKQGHPYKDTNIHKHPLVHKVSGNLSENIEIFKNKKNIEVGVDTAKVPYVEAVIFGIPGRLIPRDFLAYSLVNADKKLRQRFVRDMKKAVKDAGKNKYKKKK